MRPRRNKIPPWASKLKKTGKNLPKTGRIKLYNLCREPPCEMTVEIGASFFRDPSTTSKENIQDLEVWKSKGNVEAEVPLPQVEDCWTSDSRYQTSEEKYQYHNEGEDDIQSSLDIENFKLLDDSPGTSGRPCPQCPTFDYHQVSSELTMLRQEVGKLHTRIDTMANALNAFHQHAQIMQQILEAHIQRSRSQKEICIQRSGIWGQPVTPTTDHPYSQHPAHPNKVFHSLLAQSNPSKEPHTPPPCYPTEWLQQLGSHLQSTPVSRDSYYVTDLHLPPTP